MNISLSWADYALIAGACLVGYYIVIGLLYYRKNLLQLLQPKGKKAASFAHNQQLVTTMPKGYQYPSLKDNAALVDSESVDGKQQGAPPSVDDFMDEIYAYTEACRNTISKEELGSGLRKILHKYPSLVNSSLQPVLAGIVATASENNCSIQWSEDELNELWNG